MMGSKDTNLKKKEPKKSPTFEDQVTAKINKVLSDLEKKDVEKLVNQHAAVSLIKKAIQDSVPCFSKHSKFSVHNSVAIKKSLCLLLSDIHIGSKIPGYDMSVFSKMLQTLYSTVAKEVLSKGINEIVVFLNGDIVDGSDIYPGHQNFICMPVAQQSIEGAKYLADMIENLSRMCKVRVHCVAGNHGRKGRKGESTLSDNWDTVLYNIMAVHLKNEKNVTFDICSDWKNFVKVQDLTVLAFHGDDIGHGNPLTLLPKSLVNWGDMFRKTVSFDVAITGHYHLPMLSLDVNGRELFMNGAFPPASDFVEKKIKSNARAGQVMFIVEDNKIKDRNLIEL